MNHLSGHTIWSTRHGKMFVPDADEVIGRSLRLYGEWAQDEIQQISSMIVDDGCIIDVGASIGVHTLAFANMFPKSRIISLEPQERSYIALCMNITMNGLSARVDCHNVGAGAHRGYARIDEEESGASNPGARRLTEVATGCNDEFANIKIVPLDELGISGRVSLIKIDVEGMELDVLQGAQNIIHSSRPIVYAEALTIESSKCIINFFETHNYHCGWLRSDPFQKDNFNKVSKNIWGRYEFSIVAAPDADIVYPRFVPATGRESEFPNSSYFIGATL